MMGQAMNYDRYATRYRQTRFAVDWILEPLSDLCKKLTPGDRVIDVGSGTGNYVIALWQRFEQLSFFGFDRSSGMLEQARARMAELIENDPRTAIEWQRGDADQRLTYPAGFSSLLFAVDVIHHLEREEVLFAEAARVLAPGGTLAIITDSPDDLRARSLSHYFPETLEIEQRRYPQPETLDALAKRAGLTAAPRLATHGELPLTREFADKLEQRCASALRLISDEAHQRGVQRVRAAALLGESWQSHYTVYRYLKPDSLAARQKPR